MDSRVLLSIIFPSSLENYFFFVVRYKKKAFLIIELFLSKLSNFQDNYIAWPFLYPQTIASFFFFFLFDKSLTEMHVYSSTKSNGKEQCEL